MHNVNFLIIKAKLAFLTPKRWRATPSGPPCNPMGQVMKLRLCWVFTMFLCYVARRAFHRTAMGCRYHYLLLQRESRGSERLTYLPKSTLQKSDRAMTPLFVADTGTCALCPLNRVWPQGWGVLAWWLLANTLWWLIGKSEGSKILKL